MNGSEAASARRRTRAEPAGDVLGRYTLLRRLGSGGFGTVWLGRDERLEREVAVKVVPRDRVARGRGWREALAAARLSHPAIVALYEAGADDEAAYLVSELVRGETLDVLFDEGALSDRDVAAVGMALADALAHAHAQGVIHRDVKPANVIVPDEREEGDPPAKLTDFGVAHVAGGDPLTRTGDVVGTLAYMAPEQAEGRRVTPAADLWALALVVHEGLAGTNPVRADSPAATARRLAEPLPSLGRRRRDLPVELCAAVDRALDPDPARRGTVRELRRALAGARGALGEDPGVIAAGRLERLAVPPGRSRARLPERAGGALAAAALAAGAVAAAPALPALGVPVPVPAGAAALAAGAAALLLPRLAWLLGAVLATAWLATTAGLGGAALVLALALAPVPLLLPRAGSWWSVPGAAPALGVAGLAVAFPVVAALPRSPWRRAVLGAAGAWWLLLGEALTGRRLLAGPAAGTALPFRWEDAPGAVVSGVLRPLIASPLPVLCAVWAVAAVVLPWLVRDRTPLAAAIGAVGWGAALAAVAAGLPGGPGSAEAAVGGLVAAAGALVLGVLGRRGEREGEGLPPSIALPDSP